MHTNEEQSTNQATLTEGTRVRATRASVSGDVDLDDTAARPGREYDVFAAVSGEEGDDPGGRSYYLLDSDGSYGGSNWAYPEDVEVVMTVEAKAARKLPDLTALRNAVAGTVIGMYKVVEVSETDTDSPTAFRAYGETDDGLRVGFTVTVSDLVEVDW
jgi:hypothetical protein